MLSDNFTSGGTSNWDVPDAYDIAGMAFDGQFRLILERITSGGPDIFGWTFDTFADLVAGTILPPGLLPLGPWVVPGAYDVQGIAYLKQDDGSGNDLPLPSTVWLTVIGGLMTAGVRKKRRRSR